MNPNLSQTPYFIRALWEWCSDAGLSPQIVVHVDASTQVPHGFVVDGRIVLDISAEATNQLELGDEWITFQARFGTKVENIAIPVGNVMAIFAEETNQGMAFDLDLHSESAPSEESEAAENAESEVLSVEDTASETLSTASDKPKGSPLKIVK
ncbi:MAG: ClpXP protease specificity-enhancing factor [Burkholderiaceae bacterium]|jgi:stringent starvation protein B